MTIVNRQTQQSVQEYWRNPWDPENQPERYVQGVERSRFLVGFVSRFAALDARLLEIGCNVGRNLHFLHEAGFRNLAGIEISQNAVDLLLRTYPDTAARARVYVSPVEDVIPGLPTDAFDVTFTMAVLEHIHPESEWSFDHIPRITKSTLITVEDERTQSVRHFPRNYRKVFESRGLRQIARIGGRRIPGLESRSFVARAFTKSI